MVNIGKYKEKKNIFFDLDGTIFDVSYRIYQAYKDILKNRQRKFLGKKEYLDFKRRKSPLNIILEATNAIDLLPVFEKEWEKNIEKPYYLNLDKVFPGAIRILSKYKPRYNLILVTLRRHPNNLYAQLKNKKIYNFFDKILIVKENPKIKKWESKALLIKKHFTANRRDTIIGDTETDILAGKFLKIKTVGVESGMRNKKLLKLASPDIIIKNLSVLKLEIEK
jgi:phosphoglycolate phosphatase-like HAD superfamily hydrolase